jgi:5-methylcytosine-specific restriction endonuclease McrA
MKELWYPLNRVKHIGYINNIKKKISKFVLDFKKNGKCSDCGFLGKDYPEVLDFDHLRDKKFNISEYRRYTSGFNKVKEEISKCDLVCSNCHRIRTVKRKLKLSA